MINYSVTPMLAIRPCSSSDFTAALALMKVNMEPQLVSCGLSWDDEWHRRNYSSKDYYSIFSGDSWIGFEIVECEGFFCEMRLDGAE